MTFVYVLEVGCYEQAWIQNVYASPEVAMADHAPARPTGSRGMKGHEYGSRAGTPWSYEWTGPDEHGVYDFGADWDDAAAITRYEVKE